MATEGEIKPNNDELCKWLQSIGLSKYESALIEEGVENLATVKELDDEIH